ncbi:tetratricopeptide repeat protein [Laspinema sp. A4]|uniref:serine/threonine-protein kinase n=1 Tax=Laspinema sp. D2d TaxID=2953686 RepID=UPI0021BB3D0D|nr:serine/threonine-protein kinase [Laspinema sp. D2d]MCT7984486.1 tetratricopeptide repeat protein [Laspinema sp. D2d]
MQLMNAMTGQLIQGRYQLIKDLKRGAFGKLYLAEDRQQPDQPRPCVIKQLQPNLSNPILVEEARGRLQREIKVMQKLSAHPLIPGILDGFEEDQKFYIVEEFIPGQDLSQEIIRGNRWSEGLVMALLHQVLEVLAFIHQHSVIHRNIKPSNLIRRTGDRKIIPVDFGSFKEIETLAINPQGQVGTAAIGTPGYVPIEQLGGKPRFNSDIYALGMTAIQALTGVPPRELERDPKTGQTIWHHLAPVNPKLAQILDKMVRSDYQDRYQQATEVIADLRSLHEIGNVLDGRYQLVSLLAERRFSKTFLGEDLQRQEMPWCTVEQIKPAQQETFPWWEAKSFFDAEAQLLHRLGTHDRIPTLLADFEQNGAFYLVQEQIEGQSLSHELLQGKKYEEKEAVALLQEVLETLAFVHEHHAIHLDLTPWSIFRRQSDGKLMLTNFGSVKQIGTLTIDQGQLTTSTAIGTPGYMPKEQMVGNPRPNSDIYALGAVALQALTGVRPDYLGTEPHTGELSWRKHVQVSDRFGAILDKMVRSYFRERYESAQEVLADLRALQDPVLTPFPESVPVPLGAEGPVSPQVPPEQPQADPGVSSSGPAKAPLGAAAVAGVTQLSKKLPFAKPWPILAVVALMGTAGVAIALSNSQQDRQARQDSDQLIEKASLLLESQDYLEALDQCDQAIGIKADHALAWKCRGDALYLLDRYESALVAYDNASRLEPKTARYWNNRGETLYQLQRYEEAIAAHDRALELRQNDVNALKGRGLALLSLQRYDEALTDLDQALEVEPNDPQGWERKALVLDYLQRPEEADGAFERALAAYDRQVESNPDDLNAWLERGRLLNELQRLDEAISSYDRALEINPEFYLAWNAKGTTLYSAGQFTEGLAAYDQALAIEPEFYKGWHNRGVLLSLGLGRHFEAIEAFDRALAIEEGFHLAWRDRGLAQMELRRYPEAVTSFDQAVKFEPKDGRSWANRGISLNELRRYSEAIESFDQAIAAQTQDALVWTQRGIALESMERYDEALASYEKALEIQPDFYLASESRDWVLVKMGR